jgi:exonuclease VII large subunit
MASWTDALSGLFKGTPQAAPSYSATTSDVPKWLQDYTVDLFSQQRAVSGLPYQTYQLPRIAQATDPTKQAYETVQNSIGDYQQPLSTAMSGTQNLAETNAYSNVGNYMNPYNTAVTDQIAKLGARNLTENLLPGVSDQFIRAGSFGGSRMGEFGNRAVRDTQESILGQQANVLNTGYNQAMTNAQQDMTRQQGALAQVGDLAKLNQGLAASDAAALQSIGAEQQGQTQRGLDVAYQDFLTQQQFPQQQLNNMSTTLRGLNPAAVPSTQTMAGSQTQFSPSPLSQVASAYFTGKALGAV